MAALIDAIDIKRKAFFEFENVPYCCMEAEVSTPTARGGQTLVRLKMRNLLTSAVFEKTFKASDKFKEPDLQIGPASYLYSDNDGSHFLDQETYETLTLTEEMIGNALDFLVEGAIIQLHKFNGNPIGLELPLRLNWPSPTPSRVRVATRRAAASPRPRGWKPAWKSAFLSSLKKARRSKCSLRRASSPGGRKFSDVYATPPRSNSPSVPLKNA